MDNGLERQPRPYCGPAGSNPVYETAPDHPGHSQSDIPIPSPAAEMPEERPTSPRPSTLSPATYQAKRIIIAGQIAELQAQRIRFATESRSAHGDLAVINDVLEKMTETASTSDKSSRRTSLGAVFSERKKAEEEARLQERVIAQNLDRRAKESERDRIRAILRELTARMKGVTNDIAQLKKDWDATWMAEQVGKDAVKAWEAREAERKKKRDEERAMAAEKKKAAESTKQEFDKTPADIHTGKQKTLDPSTNTTRTSADNRAWPPSPTQPPSRPLPTTPDDLKAKMTRRERMMQEEIAEMDRCFAMMQQQEAERASTRAAQEAAELYTDESLRPPPTTAAPPPAYRPPSPPPRHVSVPPSTRPDGSICHHKGLWGPGRSFHRCVRCLGPERLIGVFRCKACGREVCGTCWGDLREWAGGSVVSVRGAARQGG